jgi:hypothetical protein
VAAIGSDLKKNILFFLSSLCCGVEVRAQDLKSELIPKDTVDIRHVQGAGVQLEYCDLSKKARIRCVTKGSLAKVQCDRNQTCHCQNDLRKFVCEKKNKTHTQDLGEYWSLVLYPVRSTENPSEWVVRSLTAKQHEETHYLEMAAIQHQPQKKFWSDTVYWQLHGGGAFEGVSSSLNTMFGAKAGWRLKKDFHFVVDTEYRSLWQNFSQFETASRVGFQWGIPSGLGYNPFLALSWGAQDDSSGERISGLGATLGLQLANPFSWAGEYSFVDLNLQYQSWNVDRMRSALGARVNWAWNIFSKWSGVLSVDFQSQKWTHNSILTNQNPWSVRLGVLWGDARLGSF